MIDDYDRTMRIIRYKMAGFFTGAIAGFIGGVASQEYLIETAGNYRYFMDILAGLGGATAGGIICSAAGTCLGVLVNKILEEKNNFIQ